MWPKFKRHLMEAYINMQENNTSGQIGYGTVNMAHEEASGKLKEAIKHLLNAIIHNKTAVANLVQSNKTPMQQVKELQTQINTLTNHLNLGENIKEKSTVRIISSHGHKS
eukprot:15366418-Ditylum_brightwellii.AAC.1